MSKWKRPATRTYDYNTRLGEHYYKPQLDYLETRKGRAKTPPPAKTFAERFAEDPIYGNYRGPNLRRSGLGDGLGESDIPTMSRFASMDDMNLGNKRRSMFTDLEGGFSPTSSRLVVGDRLLDSVGIKESYLSQPLGLTSSLSSSSKLQQQSSEGLEQSSSSFGRRKVGFIQSAGADIVSEDPFKSTRLNSKFDVARKQADDMMSDMSQDADTSVSRFRARVQARKEENRRDQVSNSFGFAEDDDDTAAIRNRVNKIGERAKARLAQLDDDYPELQIGSSLASRRAGNTLSFADEEDDRMGSRSLKISKRTIKASYDME